MRIITRIALPALLAVLGPALLPGAGELSNRRAPGFALPDSKGNVFDSQDYRGKVLLLEFMQTNCPHCNVFADILEKAHQKYGDKLAILSVLTPPDTAATASKFIAAHKITTPVVFDCGQAAYSYLKSASFTIPHVFLIDAAGTIRNDFGYEATTASIFEGQGLSAEIDKLLAPAPASQKKK